MRITHTTWPEDVSMEDESITFGPSTGTTYDQPGFSVEIGWNKPGQWRKPYISIKVWRTLFQIGWLFD